MDLDALFKISHGVYLTGAKDEKNRLIGSCIDSVMVVETNPQQVIVSLNNTSYTMENVVKNGVLTLSVLPKDIPDEIIQLFGTHTSKDTDKWTPTEHILFHDLPVYHDAVAYMYLRVKETFLTNGHHVFLCDVEDGVAGTMKTPLIYADYQAKKTEETKWKCPICGYVYKGKIPFEELPEDWVCPLCHQPKSVFIKSE